MDAGGAETVEVNNTQSDEAGLSTELLEDLTVYHGTDIDYDGLPDGSNPYGKKADSRPGVVYVSTEPFFADHFATNFSHLDHGHPNKAPRIIKMLIPTGTKLWNPVINSWPSVLEGAEYETVVPSAPGSPTHYEVVKKPLNKETLAEIKDARKEYHIIEESFLDLLPDAAGENFINWLKDNGFSGIRTDTEIAVVDPAVLK